jgi:hypothetical protein
VSRAGGRRPPVPQIVQSIGRRAPARCQSPCTAFPAGSRRTLSPVESMT